MSDLPDEPRRHAQAHRDRGRRHRRCRRRGLRGPASPGDPPPAPRRSRCRQPARPGVRRSDPDRLPRRGQPLRHHARRRSADPLRPRRHAVVAHVGEAVRLDPRRGVPGPLRSTDAATASRPSATPAIRSTTSPTMSAACSRPSTCAARCSWVTRWAGWRCRRSPSGTPTSPSRAVSGLVLMSTAARAVTSDARRLRGPLERVTGAVPNVGAIMRQQNLGLLIARDGLRRLTAPEPRRSHPSDARRVLARHAARLVARHALARPHARIAVDHASHARDRRYRRRAHTAEGLSPDRVA